jgi:hypothetical protein
LRFEINAIEGGADCSERQCLIAVEENAVEENADKREESEISSPGTGERLELVRANAREVCGIVWHARCRPTATECYKI